MTLYAGQSLQPGFYSHEPAGVGLQLSHASSGLLCSAADRQSSVCSKATMILVTGEETCTGTDGQQRPCTRYGYQFDYTGAQPGTAIQCETRRRDAFRSRSRNYTLELEAADGSIFYPSWIPYAPVDRKTMLTEVHECSYQGKPLVNIEFIVSYEPGTNPAPAVAAGASPVAGAAPVPGAGSTAGAALSPGAGSTAGTAPVPGAGPAAGISEPYIADIPDACSYLTQAKAQRLLDVDKVQAGGSTDHVSNLSSRCDWYGMSSAAGNVGYLFKFMPYEMFDLASLSPKQLGFNVGMVAGGQEPKEMLTGLGKAAFAFDEGNRTTLLVITGIQGPPGGAQR